MYDSNSGKNSLEVSNVGVVYNNGFRALNNVTFNLDKGVIAALVGINGSGKSTLFKAIMGFVPLKSGTIKLLGLDTDSALKKNLIAYVPQNEEIDWDFPILVEDVVMMGRYGHMNWLRIPKENDFKIVADLSKTSSNSNKLVLKLSSFPDNVFNARITKEEVQYIVVK